MLLCPPGGEGFLTTLHLHLVTWPSWHLHTTIKLSDCLHSPWGISIGTFLFISSHLLLCYLFHSCLLLFFTVRAFVETQLLFSRIPYWSQWLVRMLLAFLLMDLLLPLRWGLPWHQSPFPVMYPITKVMISHLFLPRSILGS